MADKKPVFEEKQIDDETFEFRINGKVIATANHDEHGWAGIEETRRMFNEIKKVLG